MNFRPEHDPQRIVIAPGVTPKSGTVAHVIKWCRDTRHRRSTFTTEMARSGCSELVSWAANGSQGMTWSRGRRVPPKLAIADFLERKMGVKASGE